MNQVVLLLIVVAFAATSAFSQTPPERDPAAVTAAARDLAKETLTAHGGEKLTALKSLILRGSATATAFNQAIPGGFAMIFAGNRYRLELENPFQPLKQIFDGRDTFTATPNSFRLPPIDRTGFYVLMRIGDPTFPVTALPETAKKRGFRITAPDGRFTDFYIDEKTKQVKSYDSAFDFGQQQGTTSVEIDKYRLVDGVWVPEKFAQRFDLGSITAYCEFKAKDILVNTPVADDVFTMK